MKNIDRILESEMDSMINKLKLSSSKDVKKVMKELFSMSTNKLMNNMGSVEANEHNQIAKENWDFFIQNLTSAISEEQDLWFKNIKEIKLKILTYKYFSKQDLIKVENIDNNLRMEIKPYFTALQNYIDFTDFRHKLLTLPTELLYNIVRYMFYISPDLNKSIKITNEELKDNVNRLLGLRMEIIKRISAVSKGYQNIIEFREIKELYDCGVAFEDNYLNRALAEFIVKMSNHHKAFEKLKDLYPGAILKDLKNQAETSSAYLSHINAIKSETGYEYFTTNGEQIGMKLENEIELVKKGQYDGYVINNDSRLKEPHEKIKTIDSSNLESTPTADGSDSDGSGGGGGGFSFGGVSGGALDMGLGNADMGGEFAEPGEEGEIPGIDDTGEIGVEADGEPMPDGEDGKPIDFGTEEDNTPDEVDETK